MATRTKQTIRDNQTEKYVAAWCIIRKLDKNLVIIDRMHLKKDLHL